VLSNPTTPETKLTMPPKQKRARPSEEAPKAKRAKVQLNELAWKEVAMPDRLDDVEGFFGLEEVDDVDIVNEDGKIGFQVCCCVPTASLDLVTLSSCAGLQNHSVELRRRRWRGL
jgi:hypothetical protein